MEKKYELTDQFIEVKNRKLYRIKALRDFYIIKKGDLGGYIEKEINLSHHGTCWVYDDACVYGDAWIYNDAKINKNAQVYDNVHVYSFAQVYDNALVYGQAHISGEANIYGNAHVYGQAHISGNSLIYGDAQVYGDAHVSGYARVYNNAWNVSPFYTKLSKNSITSSSFTDLTIGYETQTIEYWKENFREFAKKFEYSESEIELYIQAILMAEKYIKFVKKMYTIQNIIHI